MDLAEIEQRLKDGEMRMNGFDTAISELGVKIDDNTSKTNATHDSVAEVLEILHAGKSFFKFVNGAGTLIKWVAGIVAPLVVIWATIKGVTK